MNIIEDFAAENTAMAEVAAHFQGKSDSRWLIDADPLIARAMTSATTDVGFERDPDPARAIVVMSNSFSYAQPGDDTTYGWRDWWYLSDIDTCATGKDSVTGELISDCHRCGWNPLDIRDRRPAVSTVHVPRGRFVVEFALCNDCTTLVASLAPDGNER